MRRAWAVAAAGALLLAGCSAGHDAAAPETVAAPSSTQQPTTKATPKPVETPHIATATGDEAGYISQMKALALVPDVYTRAEAISYGHSICEEVAQGGVQATYNDGVKHLSEDMDTTQAGILTGSLMLAATTTLCGQYHEDFVALMQQVHE